METPQYYPEKLAGGEAEELSWDEFKERMQPFRTLKYSDTGLEFLLTPKSPSWTYQDVNIFAGSTGREVQTIENLNDDEGKLFFDINKEVALGVISPDNREVNVSIGFNVEDHLPGQHSIQTKLHSHIFVTRDKYVEANRRSVQWKDLDWFKRLSVVEPFAPLYKDFVETIVKKQKLFTDFLASQETVMHPGYFSMRFKDQAKIQEIFPDVRALLGTMQKEYEEVEHLFTDKNIDPLTNRYIPLEEDKRRALASDYIKRNQDWLSQESIGLLDYLVKNIKSASGSNFRDMKSASEAWFTRGFVGLINLSFSNESDIVRFDILPRVITTSSVSKILAGEGKPIVLDRGRNEASVEEKQVSESYLQRVANIIDQKFSSLLV